MITAIFLRNIKTYQNINFIPLSNGKNFSAIAGENGAGKSSILEALNSYFNGAEWNYNHIISANGFETREPFICPLFLIPKGNIDFQENTKTAIKISDAVWSISKSDFNPANQRIAEIFFKHRDTLKDEGNNSSSHYLLPIGLTKKATGATAEVNLAIFESAKTSKEGNSFSEIPRTEIEGISETILKRYNYIYMPSEIDFLSYTRIEGKTTQALLGRKLEEIIKDFIDKDFVAGINKNLNAFLAEIAKKIDGYEYKKPAKKQTLFNQSHLTGKVIEAFFESKILSKKKGDDSTPVNNLSSGEKRRAIIDVAKGFLLKEKQPSDQHTILAIDEPELSLHISACFDQFEKIREISESGVQAIVATHWYGFMPIVSNGTATYISKDQNPETNEEKATKDTTKDSTKLPIPLIDLRCFREDIKKLRQETNGSLPAHLELKSVNDLVQTIIASITASNRKWLICEGSSDKIYLDHYFSKSHEKPYIVAAGAGMNVKRIYNYLTMVLDSEKDSIQGRVFFLLDTDKKFEPFESNDSTTGIIVRRLLNEITKDKTSLYSTTDNTANPPTEIEDALDAEIFLKTLNTFKEREDLSDIFGKFKEEIKLEYPTAPSGLAYNLRERDRENLISFFDRPKIKVQFALKYIELLDSRPAPAWINDISSFLFAPSPKPRQRKQKS